MTKEEAAKKKAELKKAYTALKKPFPVEAYVVDSSRGFPLIGARAAYVVERLNDVFGLVGDGWFYRVSPATLVDKEQIIVVLIQYNVGLAGTHAYYWSEGEGWTADHTSEKVWSEPVFGYGGNRVGKGGTPVTDALKSAVTNGISKAASKLGVSIDSFKGRLTVAGSTILIAGEESGSKKIDGYDELSIKLARKLLQVSPGTYDEVRTASDDGESLHEAAVLTPLVNYIGEHDLSKFVSDNINAVTHTEKGTTLKELTGRQVIFLTDVVLSIASEMVTWEQAVVLVKDWDGNCDFENLVPDSITKDEAE